MTSWKSSGIALLLTLLSALPAFAERPGAVILKSGRHYSGFLKDMGTHYEVRYYYSGGKRWVTANFVKGEVAEVVSQEESATRRMSGWRILPVFGGVALALVILGLVALVAKRVNFWIGIALPVLIGVASYYGAGAFGLPVWLTVDNVPPSGYEGSLEGVPLSISGPLSNACAFALLSVFIAGILLVAALFFGGLGWLRSREPKWSDPTGGAAFTPESVRDVGRRAGAGPGDILHGPPR